MKHLLLISLICFSTASWSQSDTNLIKAHMTVLTKTAVHRNYENIEQLNEIADYLHTEFAKYADTVYFQSYFIGKREYKNVIASFGVKHDERIIVGAHYDVCGEQEGADDNASGTVGLLELARQLDTVTTAQRVDLVAYTLEEPPFFRSEYMGSYIHAQSLVKDSINVKGMICLEMIGYFADARKTQSYPLGILKLFYGSRGNYITLVNQFGPGKFARKFTKHYKRKSTVKAKQFKGPKSLPGIDFSDHLNYWQVGISSLMITDTAFYRNKQYHQKGDTMEQLDYERMAKVIDGIFVVLTAQ